MAPKRVCLEITICLIVIAKLCSSQKDSVPDNANDEDGDNAYGLPGSHFEYRFELAAGSNQCFFQKFREGSKLHISFEVLRGADKNINMYVRMQNGHAMERFQWVSEGQVETLINRTEDYSLCFDNGMSRFSSKVIYFYVLSYSESRWQKYAEEFQSLFGEIANFTKILSAVDDNTSKVLTFAAKSRGRALLDWYTIRSNNSNVQLWSIVLCVVIICTSVFQVYFVRRMFNIHGAGVQSTSKPRA